MGDRRGSSENNEKIKKPPDFYGGSFTAFNAENTGIQTGRQEKGEDYNDPEKFGYLKLRYNKGKQYRNTVYKLGGVLCINILVTNGLSMLTSYLFALFGFSALLSRDGAYLVSWVLNGLLAYVVPMILIYFALRYETLPESFEKHHEYKRILIIPTLFAAYFAMVGGSFITEFVSAVLYENTGIGQTEDVFGALWPENAFQSAVFYLMTILVAPFAEELIFRKLMLRPLRRFGDYSAVFLTALLFGLFHGNLTQFLYAFLGGIVLGFAVVWSGSVITSVILHMLINAFEVFRSEIYVLAEAGMMPFGGRTVDIALYLVIIVGAVSLVGMIVKGMFRLKNTCPEIPRKDKISIVLVNPLFILALALSVLNLFI